jgi:hypothetical protein
MSDAQDNWGMLPLDFQTILAHKGRRAIARKR